MRALRFSALALALLLAPVAGARATALTPAQPLALADDESVATTDDARALLVNPAATGLRYPGEFFEGYARRDPHHEWNTTLLTHGGIGFLAQRERDTLQVYGMAFAFGAPALRFGWSPYWLVAGQPKRERVLDHRVGLLSRPRPWLSLGATVDRLFQPVFRDERRARHYTLGVGWRPLAMSRLAATGAGTRLTLSGDVTIVDDGEWRQSRVRVAAELEAVPGLCLRATLADHGELRAGVTLRGVRHSIHAGGVSQDDVPSQQTYAISFHGGEERTALRTTGASRVAVVSAGGTLADETLGGASLTGGGSTVAVAPLHRQLARALEDPLTRGVLLELRDVGNMAQLEELRPRIERLRAARKPVVAFMETGGGRGDLFLASACDRTVASEEALFASLGLRSERRYYRRMLADLGVRVDRSSTGAFKSAYRNFSADSMPAADSLAVQHELDVRQKLFVDAVAKDRRLAPQALERYLDGREWPAADLAAGGVIDSVGYREDALRVLGRLAGLGAKPRTVNLARTPAARRAWRLPSPIAVVYASGGIDLGRSGNDVLTGPYMGHETLIAQLERAFHEPGVKAVVLRIESPGGSALASNLIDHALQRLRRETKRPLIVSMGSVAASGGYYIATHADWIVADRNTRTGSIGVLTIKPSFEGLYTRLKVRQESFDRGAFMGGWSPAKNWTPREQAAADSSIGRYYERFVGKVAEGRRLDAAAVREVAQGRVWMGDDARERHLVDAIGGLEAAVSEARRRVGVPEGEKIRLLEFRRPEGSFLERLVGNWIRDTLAREARLPDLEEVQMRDLEGPAIGDE